MELLREEAQKSLLKISSSTKEKDLQKKMHTFWDFLLHQDKLPLDFLGPMGQSPFFPLWLIPQNSCGSTASAKHCSFLVSSQLYLFTVYYLLAKRFRDSPVNKYRTKLETLTNEPGAYWSDIKKQYIPTTYRALVRNDKVFYALKDSNQILLIPYHIACPLDENIIPKKDEPK